MPFVIVGTAKVWISGHCTGTEGTQSNRSRALYTDMSKVPKASAEGVKVAGVEAKDQRIDLDAILVNEVGQFGRYQWRMLFLTGLVSITAAINSNEFVFNAARINTRCAIPECERGISEPEFTPEWLPAAVPFTSAGAPDSCLRFTPVNDSIIAPGDGTCPKEYFVNSTTSCSDYLYENTNTVAYTFDLACDEWRRSLIGTARTAGTVLALPVTGWVSDRWGRRAALVCIAFNTAWMGLLRYFSRHYIGYLVAVFVESAFGAGGLVSTSYILMTEVVGPKYRMAAGAANNSFFAVGQMLLGLLARTVPYWRHLTLIIYAPQLITLSYAWLFPESIRWYISKGRFNDAEDNLKRIARVNGKQLSETSLVMLRENAMREKEREAMKATEPPLVVQVWRCKPVLLRCCVVPVWWMTMTFVYYGLTINSVSLSGDQHINYVAVAAVEVPSFLLSMLLIGRVGRKPVLAGAYWMCAACQIAYIFVPTESGLAVYLLGKFGISSVVFVLYLYTSELFPTTHRHSLFAFCSMIGRIGNIVAPLTPALADAVWPGLPFLLFACMAVLSGATVLLTPETRGVQLPDTMQDAADIGRSTSHNDTRKL